MRSGAIADLRTVRKPGPAARLVLRHRPALLGRRYLLALQPRPLIDPDNRVVLIWSPKSACTAAIIWFFKLSGVYEAARAFGAWPHQYRQKVFYDSAPYRRGAGEDLAGYRVVRVIRDPYQRAVSAYRHALMSGHLDRRMSAHKGRPVDREAGYSFADFLTCIGLRDLAPYVSNTHHAVQLHPIERLRAADVVINVSRRDLFAELNRFEAAAGLPVTDFPSLDWLAATSKGPRRRTGEPFGRDVSGEEFGRRAAARGPWPAPGDFLGDETKARIRRLYAADFDAYAPYL